MDMVSPLNEALEGVSRDITKIINATAKATHEEAKSTLNVAGDTGENLLVLSVDPHALKLDPTFSGNKFDALKVAQGNLEYLLHGLRQCDSPSTSTKTMSPEHALQFLTKNAEEWIPRTYQISAGTNSLILNVDKGSITVTKIENGQQTLTDEPLDFSSKAAITIENIGGNVICLQVSDQTLSTSSCTPVTTKNGVSLQLNTNGEPVYLTSNEEDDVNACYLTNNLNSSVLENVQLPTDGVWDPTNSEFTGLIDNEYSRKNVNEVLTKQGTTRVTLFANKGCPIPTSERANGKVYYITSVNSPIAVTSLFLAMAVSNIVLAMLAFCLIKTCTRKQSTYALRVSNYMRPSKPLNNTIITKLDLTEHRKTNKDVESGNTHSKNAPTYEVSESIL